MKDCCYVVAESLSLHLSEERYYNGFTRGIKAFQNAVIEISSQYGGQDDHLSYRM